MRYLVILYSHFVIIMSIRKDYRNKYRLFRLTIVNQVHKLDYYPSLQCLGNSCIVRLEKKVLHAREETCEANIKNRH